MKLLVLDTKGMVGHVVALYLKERGHDVLGYNENKGSLIPSVVGSLHDEKKLKELIQNSDFDAVINCTAIVNQDAEVNKVEAVYINSYLPHFLEGITKNTKTVVVHRGTDCVFSGRRGQYTPQDMPDAESFYARTKAVGALVNEKDITIRTSLIGPETDKDGNGLFNWYMNQEKPVAGYQNAIWSGITTIEFAREIEYLLHHRSAGLFQCVPDHPISKYELLCIFHKSFKHSAEVVPFDNKRVDKSLVPYLGDSGLVVPDYETQIEEMKSWIQHHTSLYGHYGTNITT